MMFIEPLPSGLRMFGSCLVTLPDRCQLLTASREIALGSSRTLAEALQHLAHQIVDDIMLQAQKKGLSDDARIALCLDDPDFTFVRKKAT